MAPTELALDPRMQRTRLVVIDFESLAPAGRSPVPVEVAAITLRCRPDGTPAELARFTSLMRPPAGVPVTTRDQHTGITPTLPATAPAAGEVMAELDRRLSTGPDSDLALRLVAHNAPTERILLHGQREHCPHLAATALLDSVSLARRAVPELTRHDLSHVADHLGLTIPHDRHRALADVELVVALLRAVLNPDRLIQFSDRGIMVSITDAEFDKILSGFEQEATHRLTPSSKAQTSGTASRPQLSWPAV